MTVHLLVSATEAETAALVANGPRRDFLEIARVTGGTVHYRDGSRARGGWRRFFGAHVRQAWAGAGLVQKGDLVFADGEHVGLPLLVALGLRRRRARRVVMLGHFIRPWKRPLFGVATRLGTRGILVVHSVEQERVVRGWLGRDWSARLAPYQVDTAYWTGDSHPRNGTGRPLVVAVGSENRDYAPLIAAARDLDADIVIAAGSHWARESAAAADLPSNVTLHTEPLPFAELRDLYARAAAVVVPLHDVPNQSGITTLLEAMSMGRPVIVSASTGQQECIEGPLVRAGGALDAAATAARGPQVFGVAPAASPTGLYVPVGDAGALHAALALVLGDGETGETLARSARQSAVHNFGVERFADEIAGLLRSRATRPATSATDSSAA